ncbi:hypothetical protein H6G89_32890 [Oscillatoria sp. FACHB-1407]|uniref:polysaccharide lyase n=1 Tax=Oscillatoria sp. FACHB-1407 TaxID=2692847 RepID=UPI00168336E3|nr:hypothetical protein [Oscillatoria sp. FACHB-1407]MBD2465788.1 hypothetical protein [Oscillatoria sp. FACHB-1407]
MQVVNHSSTLLNSAAYTATQGTTSSLNHQTALSNVRTRTLARAMSTPGQTALQLEAETMSLSGYTRQATSIASGRSYVQLSGNSGTVSTRFTGTSGRYKMVLQYFDENDGRSTFTAKVGSSTIGSLTANRNLGSANANQRTLTSRAIANDVRINNGQIISIRGVKNAGELARLDSITLTPVIPPTPTSPPTSTPTSPINPNPSTGGSTDPFANEFGSGWMTRWGVRSSGSWGQQNMQVVADETGRFGNVLRVTYPAGSASPTVTRSDQAPVGGTQFYADMGMTPQTSARLSYYVRFSENFNFVKGGKLPGLYGGTGNSGGDIPNGTDGFSTRYMWRTGGQGEIYAYMPTSQDHGTSIDRGAWQFRPGVWHHIEQQVTLNQPGKSDGQVQVWFDGKAVAQEGGLTFRTTDSLRLNGLFFSTFFGGGDTSWATPQNVHADFAHFSIAPV